MSSMPVWRGGDYGETRAAGSDRDAGPDVARMDRSRQAVDEDDLAEHAPSNAERDWKLVLRKVDGEPSLRAHSNEHVVLVL